MENLNSHGKKHLATYLRDYYSGLISFETARRYIQCCFDKV